RGIAGKIEACRYARENQLPFLGICLGLQVAVIEFARHAAGLSDADSSEFSPDTRHPVIDTMPDQIGVTQLGGTMRLGAYPCRLTTGTQIHELYQTATISERHRHRYEVNNDYRERLMAHGLVLCGTSPDGSLVEAIELPRGRHPFYVGVQFHPEFKSRPDRPHPLFNGLVGAALTGGMI
ncbi:MAG: gamma-glutamyl-gamma-aminobutyrate hydrolase family protein, partial [Eubacteriales bacterium]|nr:gamma-glutamyl-gamma-aminobutyrate hydrolase family protein [Eubacteriales bacterium]